MINSLYKDSHITQSFGIRTLEKPKEISERKRQCKTVNNSNVLKDTTDFSKPAEVHFCGLAGARLANTKSFRTLMENVDKHFSKKTKLKDIETLVSDVVSLAEGKADKIKGKRISERTTSAQDFLTKYKESVDASVKDAKAFVNKDVADEVATDLKNGLFVDENEIEKRKLKGFSSAFSDAVQGFPAIKNGGKSFYSNSKLLKFLHLAEDHKSVFGALFALVLTCSLRPGAIMLLPSNKKNIDDNKYASAHSIASGLIGAAISVAVLLPISTAMGKIVKKPSAFLKNPDSLLRKDKKVLETAKTFVSMLSDTATAIPKGIITVALIPIVLKNVFGLDKKKVQQNHDTFVAKNSENNKKGGVA